MEKNFLLANQYLNKMILFDLKYKNNLFHLNLKYERTIEMHLKSELNQILSYFDNSSFSQKISR